MDPPEERSLADQLADVLEETYTIEGEIGRGGMGVVYVAQDLALHRRVAIKLLPPELAFRPDIRTRFIREAQTAARLSHPHIVPIHTVGDSGGLVYFVMGFVDGESLGARLTRRGRLPPEEVRRIMKETADALGRAHALGIIHRDVKPDNILLEGTRGRVMVTDFGIAKALSEGGGTLTGTGVVIGTPAYMSPEQAAGEGEIDMRSDLYSLGVVAYEMLIGDPPFQAPTVPGILLKQITESAPDIVGVRPECPEDLSTSIMRCLEKEPEDRWPTADALRRALESRKSAPYRSRAAAPARHGSRQAGERSRSRSPRRDRERGNALAADRPRARGVERASSKPESPDPAGPSEPQIVKKFRAHFASYVSVNGCLLLLNVATGITEPWFLFPMVGWGFGIAGQYSKLWQAGYSWRDVIYRPAAKDAIGPPTAGGGTAALPPVAVDEFGKLGGQIAQMQADRGAIVHMVERLPKSERNMLPEVVPTVDALFNRAVELARTLTHFESDVDGDAVGRLEERIAELEKAGGDPDQDRRVGLLRRQREALAELLDRRSTVEAQFESCLLAVQNVRFDLLRLRSAGVAAVLDDLTSATQQARALSFDVEAAIGAAGEIRAALGKGPVAT